MFKTLARVLVSATTVALACGLSLTLGQKPAMSASLPVDLNVGPVRGGADAGADGGAGAGAGGTAVDRVDGGVGARAGSIVAGTAAGGAASNTAGTVAGTAAGTVAGNVASSFETTETDNPNHLRVDGDFYPGLLGAREKLPQDLKLPDGSPHPCAGRVLLYRNHIDAVYTTRLAGQLRILTVAGSAVVDPNKICIRLGPDAQTGNSTYGVPDGVEVSRMVVPNDHKYAFLGKPGTILWHAPSYAYTGHAPIWAGMGAFDPEHEKHSAIRYFTNDQLTLNLVDFSGPADGHMEIFVEPDARYDGRYFSTRDSLRSVNLLAGGHGHFDWTFTKSGVYHTVWQSTGQRAVDKVQETSPKQDIIWLVGTDAELGLPAGTTKAAEIQVTAEQWRDQLGLPVVDPNAPWERGDDGKGKGDGSYPAPQTSATAREEFYALGKSTVFGTRQQVGNGVITVEGYLGKRPPATPDPWNVWDDGDSVDAPEDQGRNRAFYADPKTGARAEIEQWQITVEVPDSALHNFAKMPGAANTQKYMQNGWGWYLPAGGSLTSLVFDVSKVDFTKLNRIGMYTCLDMMDYPIDAVSGLSGQLLEVYNDASGAPQLFLSSCADRRHSFNAQSKAFTDAPGLVFTRPGTYTVEANTTYIMNEQGYQDYPSVNIRYVVGNEAINAARLARAKADELNFDRSKMLELGPAAIFQPVQVPVLLPERSRGEDSGAPVVNNPDSNLQPNDVPGRPPVEGGDGNSGDGNNGDGSSDGGNSGGSDTGLAGVRLPEGIKRIITAGHMDMSLAMRNGKALAYLADQGSNVTVKRPSGTFAFAVPNSMVTNVTEIVSSPRLDKDGVLADFKSQARNDGKVWYLPQSNDPKAPWPGFSTTEADYRRVYSTLETLAGGANLWKDGVSLGIKNYEGPGEILASTVGINGQLPILYSRQANLQDHIYAEPTHKHQNFFFTEPGVYAVDFAFTWRAATGTKKPGEPQEAVIRAYFLVGDDVIAAAKVKYGDQALDPTVDSGNSVNIGENDRASAPVDAAAANGGQPGANNQLTPGVPTPGMPVPGMPAPGILVPSLPAPPIPAPPVLTPLVPVPFVPAPPALPVPLVPPTSPALARPILPVTVTQPQIMPWGTMQPQVMSPSPASQAVPVPLGIHNQQVKPQIRWGTRQAPQMGVPVQPFASRGVQEDRGGPGDSTLSGSVNGKAQAPSVGDFKRIPAKSTSAYSLGVAKESQSSFSWGAFLTGLGAVCGGLGLVLLFIRWRRFS